MTTFSALSQGMRLLFWVCHDLSFQPTGMRLAPKVREFVDIHFSHTARSGAMPNHPVWPLSTQLLHHNRAKIGLIHDCHMVRIHLQILFVWNYPKSLPPSRCFSMWLWFSYLLLWEFQNEALNLTSNLLKHLKERETLSGWHFRQWWMSAYKLSHVTYPPPLLYTRIQTPRIVWENQSLLYSFLNTRKSHLR